jgi:S1-C subfamily serine protease
LPNENKAIKATYVGGSLYYDIAVLHIENSKILTESSACAVDVADSDKIIVGDVITHNIIRGGEEKAVKITITQDCLTSY